MMKTAAISALVLALAGTACVGTSADDDLTFETDGGKADATRPVGRFERALGSGEYGFTLLELRDDRTYDASQELVTCDPGKCTDAFSGTYKFASSHGKPYIVLYNEGDVWYSFEYKLDGDTLSLRTTHTDEWFDMTQAAAAAALELDDSDNGGTFEVPEGDDVVVKLAANATTGYSWVVAATDRSFGYPEEDYEVSGPATGSGGTAIFTWHTTSPFSLVGDHHVKLEYKRPWDMTSPPAKTFEFTVTVTAP